MQNVIQVLSFKLETRRFTTLALRLFPLSQDRRFFPLPTSPKQIAGHVCLGTRSFGHARHCTKCALPLCSAGVRYAYRRIWSVMRVHGSSGRDSIGSLPCTSCALCLRGMAVVYFRWASRPPVQSSNLEAFGDGWSRVLKPTLLCAELLPMRTVTRTSRKKSTTIGTLCWT